MPADERYVVKIETHDGVPIFTGRAKALGLSRRADSLSQAVVIAEEEDPGPQLISAVLPPPPSYPIPSY